MSNIIDFTSAKTSRKVIPKVESNTRKPVTRLPQKQKVQEVAQKEFDLLYDWIREVKSQHKLPGFPSGCDGVLFYIEITLEYFSKTFDQLSSKDQTRVLMIAHRADRFINTLKKARRKVIDFQNKWCEVKITTPLQPLDDAMYLQLELTQDIQTLKKIRALI